MLTELGLECNTIDEFCLADLANTSEACFKGLVHWFSGNADEPVTWGKLLNALRKSRMVGLADDLEKGLKRQVLINNHLLHLHMLSDSPAFIQVCIRYSRAKFEDYICIRYSWAKL